jgi:hypothetical protein
MVVWVLVMSCSAGSGGLRPDAEPLDTRAETAGQDVFALDSGDTAFEVDQGDRDGTDDTDSFPVEPPALPLALVLDDPPFQQEFNHTWNEMEPGVGELVAVVVPPAGYEYWERPTLVSPDGVLLRGPNGFLTARPLSGEPAKSVVAAAANDVGVFVATRTRVYHVAPDGTHLQVGELEEGDEIRRLYGWGDELHVLGSRNWSVYADGVLLRVDTEDPPVTMLREPGRYYLATAVQLCLYVTSKPPTGAASWCVTLHSGEPAALLRTGTAPVPSALVVVGSGGLQGFVLSDGGAKAPVSSVMFEAGRIPLQGARGAISLADGGFAVWAEGGVYRLMQRDGVWEYRVYAAERWMPSSDVRDVAEVPETPGGLFFATAAGVGRVSTSTWTVEDKMVPMVQRIVQRHDRDGAVADSRLMVPGDLSTSIPWDSDNDGGWTCYWVLAECFRHKVTGALDAKAHFDRSLERMLSLRTLTGTQHFLARSVIRIDGCNLDDCDGPDDGEWFKSPDGEWWVKGDTSNDEVTSHMFMMGLAHDLCADQAQKQAITAHVDGIVGGLVDNGYRLVDAQDGQPTRFGQFDPQYVNWWVEGQWGDGGRRSAQILGALNLAYYLTGNQKYLDAKESLLSEHHYGDNVANIGNAEVYPFCAGSGDCDELALQAFVPLIRYEADPQLRARWQAAWSQLYGSLRTQQDAFWDLANVFLGGQVDGLHNVMRWFRDYPTDLIRFPMHNTLRRDLIPAPGYYLTKDKKAPLFMRSDGRILPGDERPNHRHNTSQFAVDGGWGAQSEMDSADVLFAYWMARYYGYIRPAGVGR